MKRHATWWTPPSLQAKWDGIRVIERILGACMWVLWHANTSHGSVYFIWRDVSSLCYHLLISPHKHQNIPQIFISSSAFLTTSLIDVCLAHAKIHLYRWIPPSPAAKKGLLSQNVSWLCVCVEIAFLASLMLFAFSLQIERQTRHNLVQTLVFFFLLFFCFYFHSTITCRALPIWLFVWAIHSPCLSLSLSCSAHIHQSQFQFVRECLPMPLSFKCAPTLLTHSKSTTPKHNHINLVTIIIYIYIYI